METCDWAELCGASSKTIIRRWKRCRVKLPYALHRPWCHLKLSLVSWIHFLYVQRPTSTIIIFRQCNFVVFKYSGMFQMFSGLILSLKSSWYPQRCMKKVFVEYMGSWKFLLKKKTKWGMSQKSGFLIVSNGFFIKNVGHTLTKNYNGTYWPLRS